MRQRTLDVAAVATALVLMGSLVGCSDDDGGGPALPPGDNPESSASNAAAVPTVSNPIDPGPFLGNPCRLVDDNTIAAVGDLKSGEPDVNSDEARNLLGPGCGWDSEDYSLDVSLRINTVRRDHAQEGLKGIDSVYDAKADGTYDVLQPLVFAGHPGYPGAIAGKKQDIDGGECVVYVGIANDLTFSAAVTDEKNPGNACSAAQNVATAVLDALKKGA